MGKVRIKTLGIEELEEKQKKEAKEKHEKKKTAKAPGLHGGERVVAVGPTMEELEKETAPQPQIEEGEEKKKKKAKKKAKSKRYLQSLEVVKKNSVYSLDSAIELLKKFQKAKFDETVELHINVKEKGVSGTVTLPHGTGKKLRIKVADETLVSQIEKGKIDFDVLIATPQIMPQLAKVARILGPRGLMPNPKAGTITNDPERLALSLSKGQITFKTESQAPIIHLSIGKLSFAENQLEENVKTIIFAIGANKIEGITLKSTMSPGIKLDLASFEKLTKAN